MRACRSLPVLGLLLPAFTAMTALALLAAVAAPAADLIIGDCDGNGTVTISDLMLGVQEAQTECSWLGEADCPCDALVCFSSVPFLPPLFPIECLQVAVNNALAQPCVGTETVSNGRVICERTAP